MAVPALAAITGSGSSVLRIKLPDVAVMVTAEVPAAAATAGCEYAQEYAGGSMGSKAAVTPAGSPEWVASQSPGEPYSVWDQWEYQRGERTDSSIAGGPVYFPEDARLGRKRESGGQTFTVTYTDGTTASFAQGISDWFTPQSYPGEIEGRSPRATVTTAQGRETAGPFTCTAIPST